MELFNSPPQAAAKGRPIKATYKGKPINTRLKFTPPKVMARLTPEQQTNLEVDILFRTPRPDAYFTPPETAGFMEGFQSPPAPVKRLTYKSPSKNIYNNPFSDF